MPRKRTSPDPNMPYHAWQHHRATYEGKELGINADIPEGRTRAFRLPSRVGNRLHYPDGRVETIPETI